MGWVVDEMMREGMGWVVEEMTREGTGWVVDEMMREGMGWVVDEMMREGTGWVVGDGLAGGRRAGWWATGWLVDEMMREGCLPAARAPPIPHRAPTWLRPAAAPSDRTVERARWPAAASDPRSAGPHAHPRPSRSRRQSLR